METQRRHDPFPKVCCGRLKVMPVKRRTRSRLDLLYRDQGHSAEEAMRRDIQELKEEVRKLREEGKGLGRDQRRRYWYGPSSAFSIPFLYFLVNRIPGRR